MNIRSNLSLSNVCRSYAPFGTLTDDKHDYVNKCTNDDVQKHLQKKNLRMSIY